MSRVDWSKVSLEIKENIFLDLYNVLESPCEIEGFIYPMNSYGLDGFINFKNGKVSWNK